MISGTDESGEGLLPVSGCRTILRSSENTSTHQGRSLFRPHTFRNATYVCVYVHARVCVESLFLDNEGGKTYIIIPPFNVWVCPTRDVETKKIRSL